MTKILSNNANHMLNLQLFYSISLTFSSEDQSHVGIEVMRLLRVNKCKIIKDYLKGIYLKGILVNQAIFTGFFWGFLDFSSGKSGRENQSRSRTVG